jgi:hypothetical protein
MMLFMVFDAETIGIHGPPFAVGWVVVDGGGNELESGYAACDPEGLEGRAEDWDWVRANVLPGLTPPTHGSSAEVLDQFWSAWMRWREQGAALVANSGWPVEARLLIACVERDPEGRNWLGPHPLHEVATARLVAGLPPVGLCERREDELPDHHPIADSRQAARLWLEALARAGAPLA